MARRSESLLLKAFTGRPKQVRVRVGRVLHSVRSHAPIRLGTRDASVSHKVRGMHKMPRARCSSRRRVLLKLGAYCWISLNLSVVDEASDFVDIESDYSSRHNASKVPSIDSSAPQAKADSPEKVAVFGIANASSSVL
jgi:hypothetical protein